MCTFACNEHQGCRACFNVSVQLWKINWRLVTRGDANIVQRRINFLCIPISL